jgi:hypothetical protein
MGSETSSKSIKLTPANSPKKIKVWRSEHSESFPAYNRGVTVTSQRCKRHDNQPLTKCNDHNTRFGLTVYDTEGHHYRKGSTKIQRAFTYFDLHGCSCFNPSVIHFLPQNSELSYIFIRQMAVLITELPPFRISIEMAWDLRYTHTQ